MSASEIQFFLKQKALEDQKNHAAPVIAAKTVVQPLAQKKQILANTTIVVKQAPTPVAVAKPVVVTIAAPVQQQQAPVAKKITADNIITLTKNARTAIANSPVKEAGPPTLTAQSMKDKILAKTKNQSPAEKMKAKILTKTQDTINKVTAQVAPVVA